MKKYTFMTLTGCMLAGVMLSVIGCGGASGDPAVVHSKLAGMLTVDPSIDSTRNYSAFEVVVIDNSSGDVDTLGQAVTDSTGAFSMDIRAPFRGIFPLMISRYGEVLAFSELVVADGDSGYVRAEFPLRGPGIIVRGSAENGAWMAYRNAKGQHNRVLVDLMKNRDYDPTLIARVIRQTSNMMWSLQETYPNTFAAAIASAESVVMLDGWDDSLLVARARQLPPDHPNLVEALRAARRAEARLAGQEAALALIRDFQSKAPDDETWVALQSEIVLAHIDSLEQDAALREAQVLSERAPDSRWAHWSERAIYELENLMPGMSAPGFVATDLEGHTVSLDSLRGRVVLLEFYAPQNQIFLRELGLRNQLFKALIPFPFTPVSISLEPDTLVNEAFLEGRDIPGVHIIAEGGLEGPLARLYNVNLLPTRYLIDQSGRIVSKYVGSAMTPLQVQIAEIMNLRRVDKPGSSR